MATEMYQLEGTVLDHFTGEPLSGAKLQVLHRGVGEPLIETETDLQGRYQLSAQVDSSLLDKLNVKLLDWKLRPIPHEPPGFHDRIGEGGIVDIRALRAFGLEPGQKLIAGEIVDLSQDSEPSREALLSAYKYLRGREDGIPSEQLTRIFPELIKRPPRSPFDDCGASQQPAAFLLAQDRFEDDLADFAEAIVAPAGEFERFLDRQVRVHYHSSDWNMGETKDAEVEITQPAVNGAVGRTLHTVTDGAKSFRAQKIAAIANDAIALFFKLGFSSAGLWSTSNPLDIYVTTNNNQDYGWTSEDLRCKHIEVAPAIAPDLDFCVVPHEIFHRLQYDMAPSSNKDESNVLTAVREGGARFAENCVFTAPNRYVLNAYLFFENPEINQFDGSYATGLLFQHIAETCSKIDEFGMNTYIALLRHAATYGHTVAAIRKACTTLSLSPTHSKSTRPQKKTTFDALWGNYLARNCLHHLVPFFYYGEEIETPGPDSIDIPGTIAQFLKINHQKLHDRSNPFSLPYRWGANYFSVDGSDSTPNVRLVLPSGKPGILTLVFGVHEGTATHLSTTNDIISMRLPLHHQIFIIIASRDSAFDGEISLTQSA
jgi:hypothetical protein